jgi:1-acyl-sn-glycerol-3-phosphate acyltransferase
MSQKFSFELLAFLRALFLILSAIVYSAILGPPAIVSSLLDRSGRWPSFFQSLWVAWLLRSNGIKIQLNGTENLKKDRSCLLVSNHASLLDIPAIISAAPFPVRFIAKHSLIWFPIFGWFLYLSGHVLIDRQSAQSAVRSLKKASSQLKKGISIIVFPEGTRSPDGEVKEFKRGAFLLAQYSKFPMIPISISGTCDMLPRHGWCFWPGTIHIRMSRPIPTRSLSHKELDDLMMRVRETIMENLKKGSAEREWSEEDRGKKPHEGEGWSSPRVSAAPFSSPARGPLSRLSRESGSPGGIEKTGFPPPRE